MNRLGIGCIVAALLVPTLRFGADTACRRELGSAAFRDDALSSLVEAKPAVWASIAFQESSPGDTFWISGTLCDSRLAPLAGQAVPLVRVERTAAAKQAALPPDAFEKKMVDVLETYDLTTDEEGHFLVTGLPPGEYVFRFDWRAIGLPSVILDLRHLPSPPLLSSIERAGLGPR